MTLQEHLRVILLERGSSIVKCETDVQLGKSDVAYQTEMLEGKTPMSHCETLMSHRKQQC